MGLLFLSETTENLIELIWLEFLTCYSLKLNYPLFMKLRQIEDGKSKIPCCVIADGRITFLLNSNAHEALLFSLLNVIM